MRFDLLGDPIPRNHGRKGRPEHTPTDANRRVVVLAFAVGRKDADVAAMLGITVPTLKKHYFSEWSRRNSARLRAEGVVLARLIEAADGGNVAAMKELGKRLDRATLAALSDDVAKSPKAPKPEKLGKKEIAAIKADQVRGLYETPMPPGRVN